MCFYLTVNPFQIKYKNCTVATSKKRTKQRLIRSIWQSTMLVDGDTNLSFGSRVVYILIRLNIQVPYQAEYSHDW